MALAGYVAASEVLQLRAAVGLLLADSTQADERRRLRNRRIRNFILDPYNVVDALVVYSVVMTVGLGMREPQREALTVFLLLLKLIGMLRALEAFGFLVSMLMTTAYLTKDFVLLFGLCVGGFGAIFTLLLRNPGDSAYDAYDNESALQQLWNTYLLAVCLPHSLAGPRRPRRPHVSPPLLTLPPSVHRRQVMGDFDGDVYWASTWARFFFVLITFLMNILLLNVLISIVSEGCAVPPTPPCGATAAPPSRPARLSLIWQVLDRQDAAARAGEAPARRHRMRPRGSPPPLLLHARDTARARLPPAYIPALA